MVRVNENTLRGTATEKRYFRWLHDDLGCCLSGRTDAVQVAHVGGLASGKGLGLKCPIWQTLPLHYSLHREEEHGRDAFWSQALPGENHLDWAIRLYDCFEKSDRDNALTLIADMRDLANRQYLASILAVAA